MTAADIFDRICWSLPRLFRGHTRSWLLCCPLLIMGCADTEAVPPTAPAAPQQFTDNDVVWRKADTFTEGDTACLTTFFEQSDVGDSPEFSGHPQLFRSNDSDRRYYWISTWADGVSWRCVHFEDNQFFVTDGTQSPW